jgi:hypothetical protein
MNRIFIMAFGLSALVGCALPGGARVSLRAEESLDGPRELSVLGRRDEVVRMLEDQLRVRGVKLKRFASVEQMTEAVPDGRVAKYNQATTRYAVEIDADVMVKCFGGGYRIRGGDATEALRKLEALADRITSGDRTSDYTNVEELKRLVGAWVASAAPEPREQWEMFG